MADQKKLLRDIVHYPKIFSSVIQNHSKVKSGNIKIKMSISNKSNYFS